MVRSPRLVSSPIPRALDFAHHQRERHDNHSPSSWRHHPHPYHTPTPPSGSDVDEDDHHRRGHRRGSGSRPPSPKLSVSVPSDGGNSPSDLSPISPTTPRSGVSVGHGYTRPHAPHPPLPASSLLILPSAQGHQQHSHTVVKEKDNGSGGEWTTTGAPKREEEIRGLEARFSARKFSDAGSETHPHRPW